MTIKLEKEQLIQLYIDKKLNPYQIAKQINCNHKTVRSYLKKHQIKLRNASEYNFLAKQNYSKPENKTLFTKKSIAAHIAYLCEGWHTEKSNQVSFCNQDTQLIDLFYWLLDEVYQAKTIRIEICGPTKESAKAFLSIYPNARFQKDISRKNAIVRIKSGGKMMVRDLVKNCYRILSFMDKS